MKLNSVVSTASLLQRRARQEMVVLHVAKPFDPGDGYNNNG
jgi:hypothetical protein